MQNNSCYKNLRLLLILRTIAISGQSLAILFTTLLLQIPLQTTNLWLVVGTTVLINIFTLWRVRTVNNITELEFFIQLMADISALFLLLYFTGGASNPFASLFILQVIIAAVALSPAYTWLTAIIATIFYTILMFWNIEVPYFMHHHMGDFFNLHVQGMWLSFILLSVIIAWFVVRMNNIIRLQSAMLNESEKMAAIGILAANAAHELGTPLANLTLLAEDYALATTNEERTRKSVMFSEQLTSCKHILSRITSSGGVTRAESGTAVNLATFLQDIVTSWQLNHPEANIKATLSKLPALQIIGESGLKQAIHNLLDNAADSSCDYISLDAQCIKNQLRISIKDNGSGISKESEPYIGTAGYTTKHNGMGLGLFLTRSIITRLEGGLDINNAKDKGVIATINLPIARFAV